ncbi:TetR/AcrR family transcriptional regulator [Streptococcus equinus]|uniref:TetR/AcrR family transcriptional regulator n=1 Tax=Streptococcus equinus TaxID=1335 RepID=UPI0008B9F6C0|nr:TetR/AcrR family transcriptional regulator [Streptococcus equinus]SEI49177.1 transcriptional regulator, TetR family [Streptococcus equinus]
MSRQEAKTQDAIFTAFFELLSQKSFHDIRIAELCQKANIGRSTFYSHFASKDDLLIAVCHQLFQHVFLTSSLAEHKTSQKPHKGSLEEQVTHLFQHFKENADKVTTLYQLEDDYFIRSLKKELANYLVPQMTTDYSAQSQLPDELLEQYVVDIFLTTLSWWIKNHFTHDVSQVTNYYLTLLK